jgi:hypothetical protein
MVLSGNAGIEARKTPVVLPTCSATKLVRDINEPLLIHSWPVCHLRPTVD